MKIIINGEKKEFLNTQSLNEIIKHVCPDTHHLIAEVNQDIIKDPDWGTTILKDGDIIELIRFVGGG